MTAGYYYGDRRSDLDRIRDLEFYFGRSPLNCVARSLRRQNGRRALWPSDQAAELAPRRRLVNYFNHFAANLTKSVTVGIAEEPPIKFNFSGTNAAHLIGSWRARRETEPVTHDRLLNAHLGTFARSCR
jgi:hypothetical protein